MVQSSGFRVQGSGSRVHGPGFRVHCPGFRVRVQGSGFRVQGSGSRVHDPGSRVQGSGSRVQGSGFRIQGSGFRVDLRPRAREHACERRRVLKGLELCVFDCHQRPQAGLPWHGGWCPEGAAGRVGGRGRRVVLSKALGVVGILIVVVLDSGSGGRRGVHYRQKVSGGRGGGRGRGKRG
jgi:hypothetical protein